MAWRWKSWSIATTVYR